MENSEETDTSKLVAGEVNNMLEPPQDRDAGIGYILFIVFVWILAIAGPIYLVLSSNFLNGANAV